MVQRVTLNRRRPPDELITKGELASEWHIHTTSIDRWRRNGQFPAGIRLTDQTLRWRRSVVEAWLRQREEEMSDD